MDTEYSSEQLKEILELSYKRKEFIVRRMISFSGLTGKKADSIL